MIMKGISFSVRCPLHDDRHPSLFIKVTDDGKLIYRCYAGCPHDALRPYIDEILRERGVMSLDDVKTRHNVSKLVIEEEFGAIHTSDFNRRGISVRDAVAYGIKPARYGTYRGLAIPLSGIDGTRFGWQFCNLTQPRSPKYISVSSNRASFVGNNKPSTVIVVEGHYKAILTHCLLKRITTVDDVLVIGVTCKMSHNELRGVHVDNSNLRRCIIALDRDVSEGEQARFTAVCKEIFKVPLFYVDYESVPDEYKGIDDVLKYALEQGDSLRGNIDKLFIPEYKNWIIAADTVECTPVEWYIREYVPYKCVTVVEGKPGVGKSYLTLAMVAAATSSKSYINSDLGMIPCHGEDNSKCLIVNCEDPPSVIASRLKQIGANLDRCLIVARHIRFPSGYGIIESIVRAENVNAIVIDTLTNHLDMGMSGNDESAVRTVLSELAVLCNRYDMFALVVRHLRKASSDDDGIEAGIGSIGIAGIARSVIRVMKTDYGSRALLIKSNYGECGTAIDYDIKSLRVCQDEHVHETNGDKATDEQQTDISCVSHDSLEMNNAANSCDDVVEI